MRRPTRWLPGVVVAVVVTLTSGCVGIPTSTAPVAVTEVPEASGGGIAAVEVLAPRGGELPDEIVQGFLAASASNVRSRPVARQYLTPEADDMWVDDAAVQVIDDEPAALPDGALVTLTGDILGEVDADGVYTTTRRTLSQLFSLVQVAGEWRISNPPPGVILRESDFRRAFAADSLYFLDPTGTRVVPDLRWFLSGSPARANTLVEKLLQGPSEFLSPSVRTEFDVDVQLASNVLETRNVVVDLTGLGDRSPASLQGLSAQLVWTLKQLSFTQLTLRDDGRVITVPDVGTTQTSDDWQSYDPDFVPADSAGHFVSQGAVFGVDGQPVPGPAGAGDYLLETAGTSNDQSQLAGVGPGPAGARLLVGEYGGPLTSALVARTLSAPSWAGPAAEVWTVRDGRDIVRVVDGAAQVVSIGDVGSGPLRSVALSRDGTRAAVVVGPPGRGRLLVGRISRSDSTAQLAGFVGLGADIGDVVAVSWANSTQVLFLGTDPADGRRRPWLASIDGAVQVGLLLNNLPVDPEAVAAAPGRPALVSAGGIMYQLNGAAWTTLVRGEPVFAGTAPFYPG